MSAELPQCSSIDQFAAVWGIETAHDVATALNCAEVDALAGLLGTHGHSALADTWVEEHSRGDDVGDAHHRKDAHDHDGGMSTQR